MTKYKRREEIPFVGGFTFPPLQGSTSGWKWRRRLQFIQ